MNNKKVKALIGILISVALAVWMIAGLDWASVVSQMSHMNWWPWPLATALLFIHFTLRSMRWSWLFPGSTKTRSLLILADTIMIGNFASYVLPLRAGEFIRPAAYAKITSTPFLPAFTTVIIERLFDLVAVLLSLAAIMWILPSVPEIVTHAGAILGVGALGLTVAVIIGTWAPDFARRIVERLCRMLPQKLAIRLDQMNEQILAGVAPLKQAKRFMMVLLLTVLIWGSCFAQFWICLFAFNITDPSWIMAIAVSVIVALGVAAPSAPGFVGVYEVSCLLGFRLFGVSDDIAAAYAITTHAFQYIVVIGYGLLALLRYNLKLAEFR